MTGSRYPLRWIERDNALEPEYVAPGAFGELYGVEPVRNYDREGLVEWLCTVNRARAVRFTAPGYWASVPCEF